MQKPAIFASENGWLKIAFSGDFSAARTAFCGQCFRFRFLQGEFPPPPAGCGAAVFGIAQGRAVAFADDGTYLYVYASAEDFQNIWQHYLSLDADYESANEKILQALSGAGQAHMHAALHAARGIRILRQDPWETLCSFILSQNNNIPRIRKIIEALCQAYGEEIPGGRAFPTPRALADAGRDAIFSLGAGFRADYIWEAAGKIAEGTFSLSRVQAAETYEEARQMLCTLRGVGPKVSACVLLFGLDRTEAFPIDVWMQKVIDRRFGGNLDPAVFGNWAGLAQQYLFYYERTAARSS